MSKELTPLQVLEQVQCHLASIASMAAVLADEDGTNSTAIYGLQYLAQYASACLNQAVSAYEFGHPVNPDVISRVLQ